MTPEEIEHFTGRIQEFDPDDYHYHNKVFNIEDWDEEIRILMRRVYWEATDRAVQLLRGNIVDWTSERPEEADK